MASWAEASRCPKCEAPGEDIKTNRIPNATVHTLRCPTEGCRWYNTTWIVQINSDGTIPEYVPGPKAFPAPSKEELAAGKAHLESEARKAALLGDPSMLRDLRKLEDGN